ncbi:uncharacterized protein LOC108116556 isoform X1 [Drosophila eugracilis]|uniref:uncharacterized protein LOC108116556 isoform X1 n=1 Tax=Drosophila eugracilis TaxID=29029 RepID=UPI001BDAC32A|nr:uncharacterized protein LOC108116556 isoform X1 [Drosophila eugracilis]
MKDKKKSRRDSLPNLDQPGPSNVVNPEDSQSNKENKSLVVEDQGVPFILVDCSTYTVRSDLESALSQVEKVRMEKVQRDIDELQLPQLEDVTPPPELDMPINLGAKAMAKMKYEEDERRFKEDLQNLKISVPERDPFSFGDLTKFEMRQSENKLLQQTATNLEQIRCKLEHLKSLQDGMTAPKVTVTPLMPERPVIRREGTFDVKREDDPNGEITEALAPNPTINLLSERRKPIPDTKQIINQIGDLLMKLQLQQNDSKSLDEGSLYSYMVTIKPAGGVSNCSVQPITDLKSREDRTAGQVNNLRFSQAPSINIFSPANGDGTRPGVSSNLIDESSFRTTSLPEISSTPVKSPFLGKRPGSFLKVPTPTRFCHGRKRD